jgi:hypothetical protein
MKSFICVPNTFVPRQEYIYQYRNNKSNYKCEITQIEIDVKNNGVGNQHLTNARRVENLMPWQGR